MFRKLWKRRSRANGQFNRRARIRARRSALFALLALTAGFGLDPAAFAQDPESDRALILISIDGYRHDYPELHGAPVLLEIAKEGVRAEGLIPCFPTKTFPNHYTIITGSWAENHGVVSNNMYDPKTRGMFKLGDTESMTDGSWWEGEPLWVTAQKQGKRTATMFWPGSDAEIRGVRPTYWLPYDSSFPDGERVDQVLAWLDLKPAERPSLITMYFGKVDSSGHRHGPNSKEVKQAVHDVDQHLKRLLAEIEKRELTDRVDIVIVSDHGMSELSHERVIVIDDHVDFYRENVLSLSPLVEVWPTRQSPYQLAKLLNAIPHVQAWERRNIPDRFHWKDHARIPPVVALADEGWKLVRKKSLDSFLKNEPGGAHGYDNREPAMLGIFFARGPSFQRGLEPGAFENVHIYSLLAAVLGIEPAAGDGDLTVVQPLLNTEAR